MPTPIHTQGRRNATFAIACTWMIFLSATPIFARDSISLAGKWRFQLDRSDSGIEQKWFARPLPGSVELPGTLSAQNIGDPVTTETKWIGDIVDKSWFSAPEYAPYRKPGNIKVPFWLQPEKYYAGAAWYQRDIEIPRSWQGKRVVLKLERAHWETRAWLDGRPLGTNDSLSTPHRIELGKALLPGTHTVTIRVDNRLVVDVGLNSHSVSDHTQGNWNGIVGKVELQSSGPVWIEDLQVYPQLAERALRVSGRIGNLGGTAGTGRVRIRAKGRAPRPSDVSPMCISYPVISFVQPAATWSPASRRVAFT